MMCPMFIICLAMALLVLLGGLFLLGYAKKEGLGRLTKIASYVAILFGTVVFVGGLIASMMCGSCGKGKNCHGGKCKSEMSSECHGKMNPHGNACSKDMSECHKGMMPSGHCSGEKMECSAPKSDTTCWKDGVCIKKDKACCADDKMK